MLGNYFTLRHLVADLQTRLTGRTVEALYSQSRNELVIVFEDDEFLVVSCEPSANCLYLRRGLTRARRNSVDCLAAFRQAVVQTVALQGTDREIVVSQTGGPGRPSLVIQLFGSKANVYLTEGRTVVDAFLQTRQVTETELEPLRTRDPAPSEEHLETVIRSIGALSAAAVLKSVYPLFGSLLIRELMERSGIAGSAPAAELRPADIRRIHTSAAVLLEELSRPPRPRIHSADGHTVFTFLDLRVLQSLPSQSFDSMHEAIRACLSGARRLKGSDRERSDVGTKLGTEIARTERALLALEREVTGAERAADYELFGKLLLANPGAVDKGMKAVTLENVFSPERRPVTVPLDPLLNGPRNAERYFDRARKARHALAESIARKARLDEHYHLLKGLEDNLSAVHTPDQWEEFKRTHAAILAETGLLRTPGTAAQTELPPFRIFTVEGGFQVWAGKNSANNDLLTLKHAKPNDLWFHARGSGGSHVVLRAGTGKGEISKRAIEQAASIAAYYSKMKSSGLVPVAMTLRKHVRKPRGAPAGTVTIEREKVLMVPPRLPPGDQA